MTITEFLLARIAEDEAEAHVFDDCKPTMYEVHGVESSPEYITVYVSPDRLLAECKAKRAAIDAAWGDHEQIEGEWGSSKSRETMDAKNDVPEVVRALAAVYAEHDDYDPAWT